MEQTSMLELLQADEDALRKTLRANRSVDKSREAVAETLREELGTMLLRYNAACAEDRTRQAVADGLTATARDALDLLLAGGIERETPRRRVNAWAVVLLLAALLCGALLCFTNVLWHFAWPIVCLASFRLLNFSLVGR